MQKELKNLPEKQKALPPFQSSSIEPPDGEYFLRLEQVMKITGKSRAAIYREMEIQMFPRPVRIGKRAVAWVSSEVRSWMRNLIDSART